MQSVLNEENVLSNVLDFFINGTSTGKRKNKKRGVQHLNGSIAKYSKNLIMSFPMLGDSSLPLDTLMMVSKANERNIIQMLQLLFSSMNLNFLSSDHTSGADIIANFYKDIDPNMDFNDFIELLGRVAGDSGDKTNAARMEAVRDMMNQFNSQKEFRYDSINEKSLNDYTVNNVYGKTVVKEEAALSPYDDNKNENLDYKKKRDDKKDQDDIDKEARKVALDTLKSRITSNDLKKINALEPTLMQINYNIITNGGEVLDTKSFLAGVKSRFIPVESIDIVERFVSKDRTKMSLKNLIRATTGEISFFKDFVLCLSKIKMDAKNAAKTGYSAQFWHILEKRSAKNNLNKMKKIGNDCAAITTIILSQDTVNYMKNAYKFDLEEIQNSKMILDAYNLLGLIICDEATESVKILYDGYNEFEVAAYRYIERDNSDRDYKKTINLVNQLGR